MSRWLAREPALVVGMARSAVGSLMSHTVYPHDVLWALRILGSCIRLTLHGFWGAFCIPYCVLRIPHIILGPDLYSTRATVRSNTTSGALTMTEGRRNERKAI